MYYMHVHEHRAHETELLFPLKVYSYKTYNDNESSHRCCLRDWLQSRVTCTDLSYCYFDSFSMQYKDTLVLSETLASLFSTWLLRFSVIQVNACVLFIMTEWQFLEFFAVYQNPSDLSYLASCFTKMWLKICWPYETKKFPKDLWSSKLLFCPNMVQQEYQTDQTRKNWTEQTQQHCYSVRGGSVCKYCILHWIPNQKWDSLIYTV